MYKLIRYYIKSASGYYNLDKHMFFEQPSLPDESSFHSNDYSWVCGKFYGIQAKFPDVEILQVEIPITVHKVK